MISSIRPQSALSFLPEIERNLGSLYTALDTLLMTEQFETALHLAASLYPYWETYENLSDGIEWLHKLAGPEPQDRFNRASLSSIYALLGNLLRHQSEYGRATTYYERGLACLNDLSDATVHTFILGGLGEIAFRQGHYEAATSFYQSYLKIGQQADDGCYVANASNALGRLATVKGDYAAALEYHQYGRHLCEVNDYQTGLAWMFNALGELERARGNYRGAVEEFQQSAAIFHRLGNLGAQMLALQNLAFALLPESPSESERLLHRTLGFWKRGPARHGMSLSMIGLSRVDLSRGNMKKARRHLATAAQVLSHIGVQLELGDRVDYEIALERIKKETGYDPFSEAADMFSNSPGASSTDFPNETSLTRRETVILRLAAQGLTDKEIAGHLVISPHTVNAHLKSIYRKLSVNNRTSAVAIARARHMM